MRNIFKRLTANEYRSKGDTGNPEKHPLIGAGDFQAGREKTPAVEVKAVSHCYGAGENRRQVLFDNHLTIHPGEVVTMTGPSGSGKTTLLTLIGTLRSLQEGSITVYGRATKGLSAAEAVKIRRKIGFIFQTHNLFDSLTAYENVKLATTLADWSGREVHGAVVDILAAVGLAERCSYKPGKLSVGQRQRVAIARALINRPKLILADEPTAALDKDSGGLIVEILREMANAENCAVLIVTHDNRVLQVADRIVHLVDGQISSMPNMDRCLLQAVVE